MGTASTVPNWIMLEQSGPWGADALLNSRLPDGVGRSLRRLTHELGLRIVLIRRPGRTTSGEAIDCFFAHTGPDEPWLEHIRLSDPGELLDLDLSALGSGQRLHLGEVGDGPLFLVCTHGRRDPCCAERGRPLAMALERRHGDRVWESSHTGGDRFAANLVCFPHGLYFGRLSGDAGVAAADAYERGRIDFQHYRGRSCYGFATQAAESLLRQRTGLDGVDDLSLVEMRWPQGDVVEATFAASGRAHKVRVRVRPDAVERRLTCHSTYEVRPPTYSQAGEVDFEATAAPSA